MTLLSALLARMDTPTAPVAEAPVVLHEPLALVPPPPTMAVASNDSIALRRQSWQVIRNGKPICTIVGDPMTHAQALAEVQWYWPDAHLETDPDESAT